jgi:hypothetical protein
MQFIVTLHFLDEEILEVQQLAYWGHTRKVWEPLVCSVACALWFFFSSQKKTEN